jgi:NADH-quinone oxidoreductase subunit J
MNILGTLLFAAGLWLLLPRAGARWRALGAVFAAAGLGLWVSQIPRLGDWIADSLFLVLGGITVAAAVATVTLRNPIYCAIWFGMTLVGTAGLLMFQGAQFLSVATIVVYAGAILVTFLFVLMLADPRGQAPYDRVSWESLLSAATGAVLVGILSMATAAVLARPAEGPVPTPATEAQRAENILAEDHVARFGAELFGRHLVAVEVAGTLLLAALVGAAAIAARATEDGEVSPSKSPPPRSDQGDSPADSPETQGR